MPNTRSSAASLTTLKTLNKVLGVLSMGGWLFFIIALYMFHYATPDPDNFYDTILGNRPAQMGSATHADLFLLFVGIGILVTLIALTLNIYLYRAGRTHLWINLILLILASVATLIYFLRISSGA